MPSSLDCDKLLSDTHVYGSYYKLQVLQKSIKMAKELNMIWESKFLGFKENLMFRIRA